MSLAAIYRNCRKEGGCRLWKGTCNRHGYPYAYFEQVKAAARAAGKLSSGSLHLRHVVWELVHGQAPQAGQRVVPKCGQRHCLSQACLELMTQAELSQRLAAQGVYRSIRLQAARAAQAARMRLLSEEQATEAFRRVTELKQTQRQVAAEFGVSPSVISDVCERLRRKRSPLPNASVFHMRV